MAMKHLDEYRSVTVSHTLIAEIRARATRKWVLMDVCGGQTHGLLRSGIEGELRDVVELIHGPGCPVCVTPASAIDFAIDLSMRGDTILVSFGDMLRVPGSVASLLDARGRGGKVRIVYTPVDALTIATENPELNVVFLGVGFETTVPSTAIALLQARRQGLRNFFVIPAHVRVQPAMEQIMGMPENRVEGFLAAGHVCVITGYAPYEAFASKHRVPVVVTGFEPVDLLKGILACVDALETGRSEVINRYGRTVTREGNVAAQRLIDEVYGIADKPWRGFGVIPQAGYALKPEWREYDAHVRMGTCVEEADEVGGECRGADVMSGRLKPTACPAFGTRCTPETPLGAPMVSSEGACAAYHRFR
jgi:hydrogenase expression/formation protein HypD